jgi:hypothetical protein
MEPVTLKPVLGHSSSLGGNVPISGVGAPLPHVELGSPDEVSPINSGATEENMEKLNPAQTATTSSESLMKNSTI